jgi:hypothetical protein
MYNKEFTLSIEDLELIEEALRKELHRTGSSKISKLLGKLHNQKIWYRPDNYISG